MGRQARLKRERAEAKRQAERRREEAKRTEGALLDMMHAESDALAPWRAESTPIQEATPAEATLVQDVARQTVRTIAAHARVSDLYTDTITRPPSNSRTDDPARRADEAAARARAQGVTVFPADPRRTQAEAKMAAALALFVGSGLDLRNPPQRRSIPRPPDGRFTPKRPR